MASEKHQKALSQLRTDVVSAQSLIDTFQSSLNATSSPASFPDPPNPLRLLQDASNLLKAQTTKLSLLIINKPFTPSAISSVLKPISGECLPALMSALELCRLEAYTVFLRDSIRAHIARVLREMKLLLDTIPFDGETAEQEGRNTLANTGVLWETCDALTALSENGLVNLALAKAESYYALLKDAIAELEEWEPDEDDDDEDDPFGSDASSTESENKPPPSVSAKSVMTPPPTPSPIKRLHADALAALRLIRLLYPAFKKRRIQSFPAITCQTTLSDLPSGAQIEGFDSLLKRLQYFSEATDGLAESLYNRDEESAEAGLEAMKRAAAESIQKMRLDWEGAEDEFSTWSGKWKERLDTLASTSDGTNQ